MYEGGEAAAALFFILGALLTACVRDAGRFNHVAVDGEEFATKIGCDLYNNA